MVADPVDLGSAAGFSVLAGPSIANTGPGTVLALDLGVTGTLAGFPPGTVTGTTRIATPEVETAHEDRQAAYDAVVAQTGGTAFGGDLAGTTFTPGLYSTAAAITNTGTITLDADGDPSAVFVFQVGAALSSAAATKVVLTDGPWPTTSTGRPSALSRSAPTSKWVGTILGDGAISFGEGASLKGRALTSSTMALANSPVTKPIDDLVAPVVAVNGGPARSTNDTTPSISGTTDEPGTPLVTVTIGSQVLTTRASAGTLDAECRRTGQGPHTVVASVTDPSGNTGTATQELTVDTEAPGVTVTGGTSAATSDTTPTISGTTTEPGTPSVIVTVGDQTLTTTASAGAWTVEASGPDRDGTQRAGVRRRRGRQHRYGEPGPDRRRDRAGPDHRRRPGPLHERHLAVDLRHDGRAGRLDRARRRWAASPSPRPCSPAAPGASAPRPSPRAPTRWWRPSPMPR